MDKIILPQIPVVACHGVYETEKQNPQAFEIRIEMQLDLHAAASSDQLADTVHYGLLWQKIKTFAETNSFNLIETLAGQIAALVLEEQLVETVCVQVQKTAARIDSHCFPAVVEITRSRHE